MTLFVGAENISFEKTLWLHDDGGDSATPQMSWFFFKNDVWRFPIGSNPNYGLELASSIVFADSIPAFFKCPAVGLLVFLFDFLPKANCTEL